MNPVLELRGITVPAQPRRIEVLLHADLFHQAQVLPEGADAGLLQAAAPP
jgi:hypothetical protein